MVNRPRRRRSGDDGDEVGDPDDMPAAGGSVDEGAMGNDTGVGEPAQHAARRAARPSAPPALPSTAPITCPGDTASLPPAAATTCSCRTRGGDPGVFRTDAGHSLQVRVGERLADDRDQTIAERLVGPAAVTHQSVIPPAESPGRCLLRPVARRQPPADEVVEPCGPVGQDVAEWREERTGMDFGCGCTVRS
jgi:hypothetical protein